MINTVTVWGTYAATAHPHDMLYSLALKISHFFFHTSSLRPSNFGNKKKRWCYYYYRFSTVNRLRCFSPLSLLQRGNFGRQQQQKMEWKMQHSRTNKRLQCASFRLPLLYVSVTKFWTCKKKNAKVLPYCKSRSRYTKTCWSIIRVSSPFRATFYLPPIALLSAAPSNLKKNKNIFKKMLH